MELVSCVSSLVVGCWLSCYADIGFGTSIGSYQNAIRVIKASKEGPGYQVYGLAFPIVCYIGRDLASVVQSRLNAILIKLAQTPAEQETLDFSIQTTAPVHRPCW